MKSLTAKRVVAIYSLVFGFVALIGLVSQPEFTDPITFIFTILLIITGILLLIPSLNKAELGLMIGCLVYYSFGILMGIVFILLAPFLGFVVLAIVGVPFSFSIVFLNKRSKEKSMEKNDQNAQNIENQDMLFNTKSATYIEQELVHLNKMVEAGLINQEDYEKRKKALLEIKD